MSEKEHPLLAGFAVFTKIPVQWGDMDAMKHVNNTKYIRWFETVRVDYLERIELTHETYEDEAGPILVAVNCNYRLPLEYPDVIYSATRVEKIGNTSITMQNIIVSQAHNTIVADGHSIIVTYDYQLKQKVSVPESLRASIEKLEGKTF